MMIIIGKIEATIRHSNICRILQKKKLYNPTLNDLEFFSFGKLKFHFEYLSKKKFFFSIPKTVELKRKLKTASLNTMIYVFVTTNRS